MNPIRSMVAATLAAILVAAGMTTSPVFAQEAEAVVYEIVVMAEPGRIVTRERDYRLAAGASIRWQGGHEASLQLLQPGLRVTLELDPDTVLDAQPLVRAVILPVQ